MQSSALICLQGIHQFVELRFLVGHFIAMDYTDFGRFVEFAAAHFEQFGRLGSIAGTDGGAEFLEFMKRGYEVLKNHPVNLARIAAGKKPANSPWLWSPGTKPALPSFKEKWGIDASVISAVDLIKGIGKCAGMEVIEVEGVTGNYLTNYKGKADAAIDAFRRGRDFVYVHVEAPDECGHRGEIENKVLAVEKIDSLILAPVYEYLKNSGEDFKILCLPDHPTPLEIRTHSHEPVPYFMYDSRKSVSGVDKFSEKTCEDMNDYNPDGSTLLSDMIEK